MKYQLVQMRCEEDWSSYHSIRRDVLWTARGRDGYNNNHSDEYLPNNHPLLLRFDGRAIGTIRLDELGNGAGAVRLVAIRNDVQRQGHGSKLGAMVEDFARSLGLHTLFVNAAPDAVGFYRKMGWKLFIWDPNELSGIASDCVQMKKVLTAYSMGSVSEEPEITIARATPEDVIGIQDVAYQGWLATYPNAEHGITVEDIEDRYKDRHAKERIAQRREQIANPPEGQAILIAKEGDRIVGFCLAAKHPDRNQLYAIYVLPQYHGRGIGTAMWQEAQRHLDSSKHTIVEVAIYNAQAIQFYGGLGFADTGKRMSNAKFKMKSGAVIPEMEMRREAGSTS